MKITGIILLGLSLVASCNQQEGENTDILVETTVSEPPGSEQQEPAFFVDMAGDTIFRITKTASEWQSELSSEEYRVLREAGTERAFTGDLLKEKRPGAFVCAACGLELFDASTKFESGTGWPSFYQASDPTHVGEEQDRSHGMVRTEVLCNRCGGHLGHVFRDGPAPTGLRYCINAVSLDFVPQSEGGQD